MAEKSKKKAEAKQGINSYFIIALAFIFSLIVILLILNSNRHTLENKISQARRQQAQSTQQQQQQAQPSMQQMQEVQNLKQALAENPDDYELNVQLGNRYFDINRMDLAIDYYNNALNLKKDNIDVGVIIDLAVAYFNSNQPDSSLKYINRALDKQPAHIQGLYNAGVINYNLGNVDQAIAHWEKLILTNGNSEEARAARGFIAQIKSQQTNQ